MCDYDSRWKSDRVSIRYESGNKLDDIVKALCYMTGQQFDSNWDASLKGFFNKNNIPYGEWVEWTFFRVKGFKKGTMHFEFLDENLWCTFNQRVAKIKGWSNMVTHSKKKRSKKK